MGTRGPAPKRDAERAGHNAKSEAATTAKMRGRVHQPDPRHGWSDETVAWYQSLASSGQSKWYEPSDWQQALWVGDQMEEQRLNPSAAQAAIVLKGMQDLGVSETARRHMRIEIERPDATATEAEEAGQEALAELHILRGGSSA